MRHQRVQRLRVLRRRAPGCAKVGAQDQRRAHLAAGHVMGLGSLIAELIHDQIDEIAKHQVHNGAGASHRRAHGKPHKSGLCDGGVDHAAGAELLDQTAQHLKGCARLGHVLANDEHGLIAAHFLGQRLVDRLG